MEKIYIYLDNGTRDVWYENGYTEYKCDGKVFVVINGNQWVGIYNLDYIRKVVVKNTEETNYNDIDTVL